MYVPGIKLIMPTFHFADVKEQNAAINNIGVPCADSAACFDKTGETWDDPEQ
jgi:hypothetical protein